MSRLSGDTATGKSSSEIASQRETVGIDALSVYIPKLCLPVTGEFAASRGIDPAKLTRGIGIERMAIPDAHEDAATMAAMSLLELMRRAGLKPGDIGKIYVGTESAVDEAKAMGTYVIGMLEQIYGAGSFQNCSTVEFKSACIGTTQALEALSYWVAAEEEDRVGIVIASDVAKYPLRSSGEYTQGAGSVSLLVKKNPRLIALERIFASFTRDENDFFRPMGMTMAVVNGKHSNQCYLDAMQGAFASFAGKAKRKGVIVPQEGECVTDFFSYLLFHIPYPRMVEYASAAIFRHDWQGLARGKEIEDEIGKEPKAEDYESADKFQVAEADYARRFSKSKHFLDAFQSKVKATTAISRHVGNIYTGSIYLGLASLMEQGMIKPGDRLCFGAYGSGCSALVFSGLVQPAVASVPRMDIFQKLAKRTEIPLEDYERLHEGRMERSIIAPSQEFALTRIDHQGYRHYSYMS